ncbi:MAG TPA: hypothetical protein VHM20_02840, partial [Gammaproteobacteria bacterium]|nr:hypothetical protein [Gammaproteobacteria bacterium]
STLAKSSPEKYQNDVDKDKDRQRIYLKLTDSHTLEQRKKAIQSLKEKFFRPWKNHQTDEFYMQGDMTGGQTLAALFIPEVKYSTQLGYISDNKDDQDIERCGISIFVSRDNPNIWGISISKKNNEPNHRETRVFCSDSLYKKDTDQDNLLSEPPTLEALKKQFFSFLDSKDLADELKDLFLIQDNQIVLNQRLVQYLSQDEPLADNVYLVDPDAPIPEPTLSMYAPDSADIYDNFEDPLSGRKRKYLTSPVEPQSALIDRFNKLEKLKVEAEMFERFLKMTKSKPSTGQVFFHYAESVSVGALEVSSLAATVFVVGVILGAFTFGLGFIVTLAGGALLGAIFGVLDAYLHPLPLKSKLPTDGNPNPTDTAPSYSPISPESPESANDLALKSRKPTMDSTRFLSARLDSSTTSSSTSDDNAPASPQSAPTRFTTESVANTVIPPQPTKSDKPKVVNKPQVNIYEAGLLARRKSGSRLTIDTSYNYSPK